MVGVPAEEQPGEGACRRRDPGDPRRVADDVLRDCPRPADDLAVRTLAGAIIGVIMSNTMPWHGWSDDRQTIVDMFERIDQALALLEGLAPHLEDACQGTISEIFDGDFPHTPRGCFAQAWSVSETLRVWHYLRDQS